jgi:hypothetical protein
MEEAVPQKQYLADKSSIFLLKLNYLYSETSQVQDHSEAPNL